MDASASPYDVLGIQPGADPDTINRAYRKLIKRHHPDRKGGSAGKAAEINRAYAELRRRHPVEAEQAAGRDGVAEAIYARHARRRQRRVRRKGGLRWRALVVGALLAAGAYFGGELIALASSAAVWIVGDARDVRQSASAAPAPDRRAINAPLDAVAIDRAIIAALQLDRRSGENALADWSRECHRKLRERPSAAALDRCAAFDDSVVAISRRDPVRDDGPFSASAVTARQMAAAALLTDDYVAIEWRLDRIRSRVELALAPEGAGAAPAVTRF